MCSTIQTGAALAQQGSVKGIAVMSPHRVKIIPDLATTGEVQLAASLGVDAQRCIHSHPIKRARDIRNALEFGVRTFVADNADEVRKFKAYGERTELLLRVSFRSPGAVCDLSRKFGCDPEDALALAQLAASLGVDVRGFSFHVGSQAADALKHVEAIEACTRLLALARRAQLGSLDTLDIGGGFPIDYLQHVLDIGRFCAPIRQVLAKLPKRVRVIAEPGRYIVGPAAIGVATCCGQTANMSRATSSARLEEPTKPAIAVTTMRNGNTASSTESEMWLAIAQPSSRLKR